MSKRALVSVSSKKGIVEFVKGLLDFDYEIISTGGTAQRLRAGGIDVIDVSQVTQFPEMMDGRVKTLHPRIHGGLLALRDKKEHLEELNKYDIKQIDMVVVNLYPFAETISKDEVSLSEAQENIDIGGPCMIRSAAKNFKSVSVITDPADYSEILELLAAGNGQLPLKTLKELAVKAFKKTAAYDSMIHKYLQEEKV